MLKKERIDAYDCIKATANLNKQKTDIPERREESEVLYD